MALSFQLIQTHGAARRGRLSTPHGTIETPVFMPVGTQGTVKGLTPAQLLDLDVRIILGNTYHLALRPGADLVAELGGLHAFMSWPRPILTDSGGYQVFSLAEIRTISDAGVKFRSHLDGSLLDLTPERAVEIQESLGSDIAMCLDECPPYGCPAEHLENAVRRTILWAKRCREATHRPEQSLFGIVQGGMNVELRRRCAAELVALDFPGYALGGFSVGEPSQTMYDVLGDSAAALPADKPRYLMGVGQPRDLLEAVARGIDMFDCVLPTRNGRNAQAFAMSGTLRLRNACHKRDSTPLESDCPCYTCRNFSRAYLHHLFLAEEMLGPQLLSLHNIAFFMRLMDQVRQAIEEQRFESFRADSLARWEPPA